MNIYPKDSKLYNLFEEILKIRPLRYELSCNPDNRIEGNVYNHIKFCIIRSEKYPIFIEYIAEYFDVHPELINAKDINKNNLLMNYEVNFLPVFKIFLDRNIDLNSKNNCGENILIHGIKGKLNSETLDLILSYQFDINAQDDVGRTALMLTISHFNQYSDIFYRLIKLGADVNIKNKRGENVLFYCVKN